MMTSQASHEEGYESIQVASKLIQQAEGILITAGAGMGVDSGLPDFHGTSEFWKTFPALSKANIKFRQIARSKMFQEDTNLAWGFYGKELKLYREAQPHGGFRLLLEMAKHKKHGYFVYTSNVDGLFQRSGFSPDKIFECHGSIHNLQCTTPCTRDVWSTDSFIPEIDMESCQLLNHPPSYIHCNNVARPNILMFDDMGWISDQSEAQRQNFDAWHKHSKKIVIIEIGAGRAVSTIRNFGESSGYQVIRINPKDHQVPPGLGIGLPYGAVDGLTRLNLELMNLRN
jgi:NAD-dependent SIR2 family protein deacetylase